MSIPRNVIDVAHIINILIPDEEELFKKDINKFIEDSWNIAPEALYDTYIWCKFGAIINKHIHQKDIEDNEWKKNIIKIFTNGDNK